jgi:hypothetical protein
MITAPEYMRRKSAAEYVRARWGVPCSPNTLAKLATIGGGPVFRRSGRTPLYTADNLDRWVESKLSRPMRSTSDVADARHHEAKQVFASPTSGTGRP